MKTWTTLAAALAFVVGLSAPALGIVSNWYVVQLNAGANCTIGRAVLNVEDAKAGSTIRSKATCSESAADVNLPADRMGVVAAAKGPYGDLCGFSGGWVYNAQGTASKSVTATIICWGNITSHAKHIRKINSTDWYDDFIEVGPAFIAP